MPRRTSFTDTQAVLTSGTFHHNQADGRIAYVPLGDCATVAAARLVGGAEHTGHTYDVADPVLPVLTGTRSWSR